MHDSWTRSTYEHHKFANEQNLVRFRKLVNEARTPAELELARRLLQPQENIALTLAESATRQTSPDLEV
jgi:hypothetical protein